MKAKFLHNHPNLEERLKLSDRHVIVDRSQWIEAVDLLTKISKEYVNQLSDQLEDELECLNRLIPDEIQVPTIKEAGEALFNARTKYLK
jgi:hypothetical protein